MIPETGNRSQLKHWLLQELWVARCATGHRIVVNDEVVWDCDCDPVVVREARRAPRMCFFCSVDVGMIVKNENARLLDEYRRTYWNGTRTWPTKKV